MSMAGASRLSIAVLMLCLCAGALGQGPGFSEAQIPLMFPGMRMQGTEEAKYETPAGCERLELRAATGERIEALFCPAEGDRPERRPTVIWFYGNGQCLAHSLAQVQMLRQCGANVLIGDYIGYGLSEGRPSEAGCHATATALYEHAIGRDDVDPARIVAGGWSLGAAVAIDLASRKPLAGLVAMSGYTSKRELARRQFPGVPPEAIEHPFLSIEKIPKVTCPTLIIHGRLDTLVPFEMSQRLREAAGAAKVDHLPIDRAGHNDLFYVGGAQIQTTLREFLDRIEPSTRPAK